MLCHYCILVMVMSSGLIDLESAGAAQAAHLHGRQRARDSKCPLEVEELEISNDSMGEETNKSKAKEAPESAEEEIESAILSSTDSFEGGET